MEIRVQKSSSARAGNGVITRPDGSQMAVLFMRAGDAEALNALKQVYLLHGAPTMELIQEVPPPGKAAGDCVIHDDSVTVTLKAVDPSAENDGRGMLGLELTASWGDTSPVWRQVALEEQSVWAGLIPEETYERVCAANAAIVEEELGQSIYLTEIPAMPVLKLTSRTG